MGNWRGRYNGEKDEPRPTGRQHQVRGTPMRKAHWKGRDFALWISAMDLLITFGCEREMCSASPSNT